MIDGTLSGRYRLRAVLGRGGMATVYRAEDTLLGREVALKLLDASLLADPEFVARFEREARAAAALSHPNIVAIFDVGAEGADRFIVMELVDGEDLKAMLRATGPLAPDRAIRLAIQLSEALAYAHRRGVVHRDVKPENILVDREDRLKVADFGIAHAVGAPAVTRTGFVVGSVHYMAPEQARGEGVGPSVDIYGAGVVLFEMLTGKLPFSGPTAVAIALAHERGLTEQHWSGTRVPASLRAIVARAMDPDPRRRFRSAEELEQALRAAQSGAAQATVRVPVSAPAPPLASPTPIVTRRVPVRPSPPGSRGGVPWPAVLMIGMLLFALAAFAPLALGGLRSPAFEPQSTPVAAAPPTPGGPAPTPSTAATAPERDPTQAPADAPTATPAPPAETPTATPEPATPTPSPSPTPAPPSPTPTRATTTVPRVIGLTFDEAENRLEEAGFKVEARRVANDAKPETVIGQEPPAGASVPRGQEVTLTVSSGPEEVEVPDLIGHRVDEVRQQVEALDLKLDVRERRSNRPTGTILNQKPDPGERVRRGTEIRVDVAR